MIDTDSLKKDLQRQVSALEADLHDRLKCQHAFAASLKAKHAEALQAGRTAVTFITWAENQITQSAVAWVLATVFIRFLEDNGLITDPILSGPQERRRLAGDALSHHFMQHPGASERDYLLHHFTELRKYPALAELLGPHNALHALYPEGYALKRLIAFWQEIDPTTGEVKHDFTDPEMNTRFLGDLYQDLSEAARKTYALLQTPDFIEEFILDRTLTPALREFGLEAVRMIDPTCGSGHFMLGSFRRLFALWQKEVPTKREAAVKALAAVHGVDLNPFAVAITRFRLIIEACHACGVKRLADAPEFEINVATGDALLHGRRFRAFEDQDQKVAPAQMTFDTAEVFRDELKHHYEVEDVEALHRILGQQYHAVVGNPPYITVKDRAVSELYRARFPSCHRKYSLSVPFMERFFDLAVKGDGTPQQPAGFVGQITSNSFMKREFGKKLIEEYLPRWDLTHVLDTAGAYIPGHGTPTAILFGKNQPFVSSNIRTVLSIRGEPGTPDDPAQGVVWQAICRQVDMPGSESEWVTVADSPRIKFHKHPWSIGGGGASELKEEIEDGAVKTLRDFVEIRRQKPVIGFAAILGEDDAFIRPSGNVSLSRLPAEFRRPLVDGDFVRDWSFQWDAEVIFPYDSRIELAASPALLAVFWPVRAVLANRGDFDKNTFAENGRPHWEYHQIPQDRNRADTLLVFADLATHNSFVLNRGSKLFNRHAPLIKLKDGTDEQAHVRLLGALNSSTACFWLKQVCFPKDGKAREWHERFEFNGTQVANIPIPENQPTRLPTALVNYSSALQGHSPAATLASWVGPESGELRDWLASARDLATCHRRQLIAWQEELDWQIYEAFGLVEGAAESDHAAVSLPEGTAVEAIPPEGIELGQRAFEIVLARRMAAGEAQSTWFERHGSTPITEVPRHWPTPYRELVERRIARIESDPNIRLIEQPEYKRRWNTESWDEQFKNAAQNWLLARLETYFFHSERMDGAADTATLRSSWPAGLEPKIFTLAQLVAVAETDPKLKEVMQEYTGTPTFDINRQIKDLFEAASVPYLPAQRYKESGLRKRRAWEDTWRLQRMEDAIEAEIMAGLETEAKKIAISLAEEAEKAEGAGDVDPTSKMEIARGIAERLLREQIKERQEKEVGPIPVPPKYTGSGAKSDFRKATYWNLRGKLDVPKERWISYPGLETQAAPSPLFAWAGWNHLQQAQALAALYVERKERDGWTAEQLTPILAGLQELVPRLLQWHNEEDPAFNMKLGDYFADYLESERRGHGLTHDDIQKARLPL
jgi:hypothetical protein